MAKVLIIESNPLLADSIKSYLASLGFEVAVANRGDQGFAMASQVTPDLILLDGVLPDKTGFQMCNVFRKHAETKAVPIILMSALAGYANQQQFARERGAAEHVSKPIKIIELGEMVNRYIGSKLDEGGADRVQLKIPMAAPTDGTSTSNFGLSEQFKQFLSDRLRDTLKQVKSDHE